MVERFHRVLVCLDRSVAGDAIVPLASYFAGMDDAAMTLLHVLDSGPRPTEVHATDALEWEIARREAADYLAGHSEQIAALGIEVDEQLFEGAAAPSIALCAAECGADLLVLSTRGEGDVGGWPVGSTAQKALALVEGAILVVPTAAIEHRPLLPPRRVMVPLDGSLRAESVLPTVVRIARASEAEVVVVHAVGDPIRTEILADPGDLALANELARRMSRAARAYLERIRARLATNGVRASVSVSRTCDRHEGVISTIAGERADLVVLSAQGAVCNPRRRFGSVTSHAIAHSPVPVLVIQHLPARPAGMVAAQAPGARGPIPPVQPPIRSPARSTDVDNDRP